MSILHIYISVSLTSFYFVKRQIQKQWLDPLVHYFVLSLFPSNTFISSLLGGLKASFLPADVSLYPQIFSFCFVAYLSKQIHVYTKLHNKNHCLISTTHCLLRTAYLCCKDLLLLCGFIRTAYLCWQGVPTYQIANMSSNWTTKKIAYCLRDMYHYKF